MTTAKEGMRVAVFDAQTGKKFVGLGTIEKVEPLKLEDGTIISENYPSLILLDNGVKTEGAGCWWHPIIGDEEEKLKKMQMSREEAKKYVF